MKIPNSINVLGKKVRIKKIKSWRGHPGIPESGRMVGRYYPDTQTIYIDTNFNNQTQLQFLLHEINHAIMDVVGIDQTLTLEMQETIAQSFASFYSDWFELELK